MKRFAKLVAFAVALALPLAHAQAYPSKPVRIIVPFTAGSATDILARVYGQKLQELWGQPVVIENRPGAGGTIGEGGGAKCAPDGYTLLVNSRPHSRTTRRSIRSPGYSTEKDFVEVRADGGAAQRAGRGAFARREDRPRT